MKSVCIIVAAGTGSRMKSDRPKQFLEMEGHPLLYYTVKAWQESFISEIILVTSGGYLDFVKKDIVEKYGFNKVTKVITGGETRFDSVYQGLLACEDADYVYIHDGARPCVDAGVIERAREGAEEYGACVSAVPVKDTIKVVDKEGFAIDTPERSSLWAMQTPQAFKYDIVRKAYDALADKDRTGITDDAMVVEKSGACKVKMVMGSYDNVKVTTPVDLRVVENIIKKRK
ncbi:MAG: 2-C-methyl-D-erythritol 4-phosphate cytidylyltransferase [Lachnospiraceae bacterium]|nr:2-C-methyl-D-erythritol 4-phosphate cytidylyltransferase [Lachnospiraceae bacterium]